MFRRVRQQLLVSGLRLLGFELQLGATDLVEGH